VCTEYFEEDIFSAIQTLKVINEYNINIPQIQIITKLQTCMGTSNGGM
jgi:hypothetical protein